MRHLKPAIDRLHKFASNRTRFTGSERGVALVEFAMIVPLLLLVSLGITDLGRAVYYKNSMENSAREAARFGIVLDEPSDWSIDGNQPGVYTNTAAYSGTATIVGTALRFTVGMDISQTQVTVSAPQGTNRAQSLPLTVRVQYTYRPVTSFLGIPDIPLVAESTMRIE